jgi:uncharacterized protein
MAASPFIVELRDLPTRREIDVPADFVAKTLGGLPMRDALGEGDHADAGHAALELYNDATHVFASGKVTGTLHVACSRCLKPVALPLDEDVRVTFMPRAELADLELDADDAAGPGEVEPAAEVVEEDLDLFPYDGDKVDLEPLIREQFILAVPFAPLCKDDCSGLCPQCGIDRNYEKCSCEAPGDPRFAALRGLKLPS